MITKREWAMIANMIRNAAATRVVLSKTDDGRKMQSHQAKGLSGELFEEIEYFQPYGFTSRPPVGSEAVGFPLGGDRGHLIITSASDRGVRKKDMEEAEVGLYTASGDFIYLKNGNIIETKTRESITNAENKAVTNTKEFEANAAQTAKMEAGNLASVTAGNNADIRAPEVGIEGNLSVSGEGGALGTSIFRGSVIILGNLTVVETITAGDNISSVDGDVKAGNISLKQHVHGGVQSGGSKTYRPE